GGDIDLHVSAGGGDHVTHAGVDAVGVGGAVRFVQVHDFAAPVGEPCPRGRLLPVAPLRCLCVGEAQLVTDVGGVAVGGLHEHHAVAAVRGDGGVVGQADHFVVGVGRQDDGGADGVGRRGVVGGQGQGRGERGGEGQQGG